MKRYIDMNTNLRKKITLKKIFFKLINNVAFGKTMQNVRSIEILNLSQQNEGGITQYQNQIIILQSFSLNIYQEQKQKKQQKYL